MSENRQRRFSFSLICIDRDEQSEHSTDVINNDEEVVVPEKKKVKENIVRSCFVTNEGYLDENC